MLENKIRSRNVAIISALIVFMAVGYMIFYRQEKTYEDCILNHMGDSQSETSSRAIAAACRNKFPVKGNPFDKFD